MIARQYAGAAAAAALVAEIVAAGLPRAPSPGFRFHGVVADGGGVTVWVEDDLTPGEGATLDATVAAHVGARALEAAKARRTGLLALSVTNYLGAHYAEPAQRSLLALHQSAHVNGLLNRRAYIQAAINWVESVLQHYRAKLDEIAAAATPEAVAAVGWDFAGQFDASDPLATVAGALAIPN